MVVFPQAKINLGLNVVRKRDDGYHEIETVIVPIPLHDALEAVVAPDVEPGRVSYGRSGLVVDGAVESDLVMRAHAALARIRDLPGLRMHLHKCIPMGGGLGGGSSDGAHALKLLDALLGLGCSPDELHALATGLGSDCPFFLQRGACLATGRGEVLMPIPLDLSGWWLVLVNPGIHVPTSEVYRHTAPTGRTLDLVAALQQHPAEEWRQVAPNVMEDHVFRTWPAIHALRDALLDAGAAHAAMSGSGASVFGLFRSEPPILSWPQGHVQWVLRLGKEAA
ncbi:MAG: 4-(cytidine 5'-diphospho)-2-C-methyl-D-erythritol kinase [Flavobacteriales bacterium]|jgi:4-diphosphocytidyl-2-C-methyl-D-erythritol kinase|nr:MAG: 4-(cytidine 5'-diphospho)-2-C-methyl-D-erythritol kinase [Flavobacteriales bacterium]